LVALLKKVGQVGNEIENAGRVGSIMKMWERVGKKNRTGGGELVKKCGAIW
jgi:hypothetical protein